MLNSSTVRQQSTQASPSPIAKPYCHLVAAVQAFLSVDRCVLTAQASPSAAGAGQHVAEGLAYMRFYEQQTPWLACRFMCSTAAQPHRVRQVRASMSCREAGETAVQRHRGHSHCFRARAAACVRPMQRRWYQSPQGPSQPTMGVSASYGWRQMQYSSSSPASWCTRYAAQMLLMKSVQSRGIVPQQPRPSQGGATFLDEDLKAMLRQAQLAAQGG